MLRQMHFVVTWLQAQQPLGALDIASRIMSGVALFYAMGLLLAALGAVMVFSVVAFVSIFGPLLS